MKKVKETPDEKASRRIYAIANRYVDRYMTKYKIDSSRVSREDIVQDNVVIYLETANSNPRERYMRFKKYYKELSEQLDIPPEVNIDDIDIPVDNVYTTIMMKDFHDRLEEVFKTLPPRNEFVIKKYYGVGCEKRYTYLEISRQLNVSAPLIQYLRARTLRRLRHPSRTKRIKDYLEFFNE